MGTQVQDLKTTPPGPFYANGAKKTAITSTEELQKCTAFVERFLGLNRTTASHFVRSAGPRIAIKQNKITQLKQLPTGKIDQAERTAIPLSTQ